jgi:hypothetical protein
VGDFRGFPKKRRLPLSAMGLASISSLAFAAQRAGFPAGTMRKRPGAVSPRYGNAAEDTSP